MQIQVNSDRSITVDASLTRFVESEAERILDTVSAKVTRVEVHLSDVNGHRSGPDDKRCVVEVRPAGARPLSTSATARRLDSAIGQALRKMQRALRSFFGRHGRSAGRAVAPSDETTPMTAPADSATPVTRSGGTVAKPTSVAKAAKKSAAARRSASAKTSARAKASAAKKTPTVKKAKAAKAATKTTATKTATAKKTPIFQARRKAWPGR